MKFRKKPVKVEAIQLTEENRSDVMDFIQRGRVTRDMAAWAGIDGSIQLKTLEGIMTASVGDWIIKGVKGECYPYKPDIFDMTYDAVAEGEVDDDDDDPNLNVSQKWTPPTESKSEVDTKAPVFLYYLKTWIAVDGEVPPYNRCESSNDAISMTVTACDVDEARRKVKQAFKSVHDVVGRSRFIILERIDEMI